jgi:outer membrane lipoprotein-sorting protein
MRCARMFTVALCWLVAGVAADGYAQDLTDPYEILERSFEAAGGLDRLLAERSYYFEGEMTFGGMEGTIKEWWQSPTQRRTEVALGPLNMIQADNGEHAWVVDQNGQLQVITNPDEATINRREVRRLLQEYAYADRESDVLTVALTGVDTVNGKNCYVVKITNNINVDSYTPYIDTKTFILEKAVFIEDDESRDTFYGDYRDIDGIMIPFATTDVMHYTGQAVETKRTLYESNPTIDPIRFQAPEEGAKDYLFVSGDRAEDIPFRYVEGHLYIPAIVDGKERLWALDTGAGITVIRKTYAKELGLSLEGDIAGRGGGGLVSASFATLPPLRLARIEFDEQTVAVIDMSELTRRLGLDIVGILGYDFLSRFVTKIDYADELVSLYDPKTFTYSGAGTTLGMHLEQSLFAVQATLDGSLTGSWVFDIGAATTHIDGALAKREGYADGPGIVSMGHGAGNEYQSKTVTCRSMEFAGFTVEKPQISFHYGGTDTNFTADQVGVLGNSVFRNFVLYCDYAHERVIVEKGAKFNQSWPEDRSGLQIAWSHDHDIEVTYVSPDTPADKAGFVKGDRLQSINGVDVNLFDGVIAIRKLLTEEPGTECRIVVSRQGEDKTLRLKLAELL